MPQALRIAYEDMFYVYNVDMTWAGHQHGYSRTCPVYNGNCQTNNADGSRSAPVHFMAGERVRVHAYVQNTTP